MADSTYGHFITVRVVAGIVVLGVVLWGLWMIMGFFKKPADKPVTHLEHPVTSQEPMAHIETTDTPHAPEAHVVEAEALHGEKGEGHGGHPTAEPAHHGDPHGAPAITEASKSKPRAKGVAFVEATISVLDYELNDRFWGWRRNDLVRWTDNVENMQLGILEVVRRTTVVLAERISRYSATDFIDKNLENAMNWFMIKPDRYWLPSAEEKYNDGLDELREYALRLEIGEARFYVRADNLIPLLVSLADLLGSADERLVKTHEKDGSPVSWFKVDDYFYYGKGVAKAMAEILHGVRVDFADILRQRHGLDLIEHAIHSLETASKLEPLLVTNAGLDGILANHRANMAAPISHARYYLDALAKALAT